MEAIEVLLTVYRGGLQTRIDPLLPDNSPLLGRAEDLKLLDRRHLAGLDVLDHLAHGLPRVASPDGEDPGKAACRAARRGIGPRLLFSCTG